MTSALRTRALVKRYGPKTALDGMDLDIPPGELLGLLGPNGAGKSTLVKLAVGLTRPTRGSVEVFGSDPARPDARRKIGFLGELFRFPGWLSADEVMAFHQELMGSAGGSDERTRLLDSVALGEVASRKVAAMSKGMQQRLGIAQALIGDPSLLLLDEPTSALDPGGRRAVRELLVGLKERGVAVLLNSHLLTEVELVCDRVVIIQRGRIVAAGTPDDMTRGSGVEIETSSGARSWPDAGREDIPALVASLVAEGERVYGVTRRRSTLEEVYLRVVKGEIS